MLRKRCFSEFVLRRGNTGWMVVLEDSSPGDGVGVLKEAQIFTVIPQVCFVVRSSGLRRLSVVSETENVNTEKRLTLFMI